MRSFTSNTTINLQGFGFYVRPGDLLAYDPQHGNSLAVYRNGQIAKVVTLTPLVVGYYLKSGFITENPIATDGAASAQAGPSPPQKARKIKKKTEGKAI